MFKINLTNSNKNTGGTIDSVARATANNAFNQIEESNGVIVFNRQNQTSPKTITLGGGASESRINELITQSIYDVSKSVEGTSHDYVIPAPPENSDSRGTFEIPVNLNTIGITNSEISHSMELILDLSSLTIDGSIASYQFSIKYKNKDNAETTLNINNRYSADQGFVNLTLQIPDIYVNQESTVTLVINYINTGGTQNVRVRFISLTVNEIGVLHTPIVNLINQRLLDTLPQHQRDALNDLLNYSLAEIKDSVDLNTKFRGNFNLVEKKVNDPLNFYLTGTSEILSSYTATETGNIFITTADIEEIQIRINDDAPITWISERNSIGGGGGLFEWQGIPLQNEDILTVTTSHTVLVLEIRSDLQNAIELINHLSSIITENVRQVLSVMTFSRESDVTLQDTALASTLESPIIKIEQSGLYSIKADEDEHIIFTADDSNFSLSDEDGNLISRIGSNYVIHKPEYQSTEKNQRVNLLLSETLERTTSSETENLTLSTALKDNEAFTVEIKLFENGNQIGNTQVLEFLATETSKTFTGQDNARQSYTIEITKLNNTTLQIRITAHELDQFRFLPFVIRDVVTDHEASDINVPLGNGVLFVLDREAKNTIIRYSLYGTVRSIRMEKVYKALSINNTLYLGYSVDVLSNINITDLYPHRLDTYLGLKEVSNSEHNVINFNASIKAKTTLLHIGEEKGNLGIASKLRTLTVNPTLFQNRTNEYIIEFLRLEHAQVPQGTVFNDDGTFLIPEGNWIICATLKVTNNTTSSSNQRRLFAKLSIVQSSIEEDADDELVIRHAQTTYMRYSSIDGIIPNIELLEGWVTIAGGVDSNGKNKIGIKLETGVQNTDTTGTITLSNAHCHAFRIP